MRQPSASFHRVVWISLGLIVLAGTGCERKSQSAVVVSKDFVAREEGASVKDPRSTNRDQWYAKVEMSNGRIKDVPVDRELWNRLRIGDKVRVEYGEGKYTGTIWSADIREK